MIAEQNVSILIDCHKKFGPESNDNCQFSDRRKIIVVCRTRPSRGNNGSRIEARILQERFHISDIDVHSTSYSLRVHQWRWLHNPESYALSAVTLYNGRVSIRGLIALGTSKASVLDCL